MNKVKIGFIGCGGNARGHMATVAKLENAEIVGVCDVVEESAKKASQDFGGRAYTDYREMLDAEEIHGVMISIPVFAHGEIELEVIDRNIPFLVEKPVALDIETATKIGSAVKEKDLITSVGYQLRYKASAQKGKTILEDKQVGMVEGRYWCGIARNRDDWRTSIYKSGGQLLEQATHTLDMMRYLIGEVDEVYSLQEKRLLEKTGSPDVYSTLLKFKNGAIGSISTTWAWDTNDWSNANVLNIFFDRYRMEWTANEVKIWPEDEGWKAMSLAGDDINKTFVDAIQTGDPSKILSDYEDGIKSMAVSIAANESARLGRPVKVDEVILI